MSIALHHRVSPAAVVLISLIGIGVVFAFLKGLNDSDLFWHLLNGERSIGLGQPVRADAYSFTVPGAHRTPHEWLSEVLMHRAVTALGPDGALVAFALLLPAGFTLLAAAMASRGVRWRAIGVGLAVPVMIAFPYATVRPQVISWALLAGVLALLVALRAQSRHRIVLLVPILAVWANLHGLFAVGLAVIAWYCLFTLAGRTDLRDHKVLVGLTTLASVAACCMTPDGLGGLLYPVRVLTSGDWGLANIPEWRSPNFHDVVQLPLLGLIAMLALLPHRSAPGWLTGLSVIGVVMALVANRNAPVAAVLALPALAMRIEVLLARRGTRTRQAPTHPSARRALELAFALLILATSALVSARIADGIDLARFPARAVAALASREPDARVLAEYGWGGYVAYELWDEGARVFVDGRNDMYPERVLDDYVALRDADPGWERLAREYGVEAILFPPNRTLVRGPAQLAGWCEALRDQTQVLLLPCDPPT